MVAVVGMFDGVHLGHRHLFSQLFGECSRRGERPLVVTFPKHPLTVINPASAPLLLTEPEEKLGLLTQCGFRREEIEFMVFDSSLRSLTAREFVRMLRDRFGVDAILRGFNNRFGTERHLTPDDYRRIGLEEGVAVIDATDYRHIDGGMDIIPSSSEIRQRLSRGDVEMADRLLGYPYRVSGTVEGGKRLGRRLGFPTANLAPGHPDKLIPADGVYACTALHGLPAMVNVGTRPTVDGLNTRRTIEAHILDLDADLYGHSLTLEFRGRLRDEIRFPSLETLRRQLSADREAVRRYFAEV